MVEWRSPKPLIWVQFLYPLPNVTMLTGIRGGWYNPSRLSMADGATGGIYMDDGDGCYPDLSHHSTIQSSMNATLRFGASIVFCGLRKGEGL